jgi:putative aminopeptidase FrvX
MNEELLRRVSNAVGIPGFEDDIQAVVAGELRTSCDETRRDPLGNVIGLKRAASPPAGAVRPPRVALAAHADEIGMIVRHVDPQGFVFFQPLGTLPPMAITSQRVTIHGRERIQGVIAPTDESAPTTLTLDELFVDVGLPREQVVELIEAGDPISFSQELVQLNPDVYLGRNFDDRIGTFCLLEAMSRVGPTQVDVYAVSTVQEELGVRGAWPAAHALDADVAIAIDGSLCRSGGVWADPKARTCELGKGTGIYVYERLTVPDRRLNRFLVSLCEEHGIPFQRNVGGGTDASAFQRTGAGARVTTIGAPVRYMHSTVQLCHRDDIEATVALLTTFLSRAHELELDVEV